MKDDVFYSTVPQTKDNSGHDMCGDFMPFFEDGRYYLYYLNAHGVMLTVTEDFITFTDPVVVLHPGTENDQDWHIGTGSVFHYQDTYYFYYTGFNEERYRKTGEREQVVLRAVGKNPYAWEKDRNFELTIDETRFGNRHWRDPQVITIAEGQYGLLITATMKDGVYNRSGCTVLYESSDVADWHFSRIIYSPGTYITNECNDTFEMNGKRYLVFSNYSNWWETRYRIADSLYGPYYSPADDMFDGRQLYAAKTVSDGRKRYLVGWQAVREHASNSGKLIWGGSLMVHQLIQRKNGSLGVTLPETVYKSFDKQQPLAFSALTGQFSEHDGEISGCSEAGRAEAKTAELNGPCLYEADIAWSAGTRRVGILIAEDESMHKWCQLVLDLRRHRFYVDQYFRIDGDQSFIEERPFEYMDYRVHVKMVLSGNIQLFYVNDTALSSRCYDFEPKLTGTFVEEGSVTVSGQRLITR